MTEPHCCPHCGAPPVQLEKIQNSRILFCTVCSKTFDPEGAWVNREDRDRMLDPEVKPDY